MEQRRIVVLGGGVAGLSTAYHLLKSGQKDVCVLEGETQLGGHASGRNAGMIRQTVSDPILAELAVRGRKAMETVVRGGWKLDYRKNGSLLLGQGDKAAEIEKIRGGMKGLGVKTLALSSAKIWKRIPVLKGKEIAASLFCPTDALLDIHALLRGFAAKIRQADGEVRLGVVAQKIARTKAGFRIETDHTSIHTEVVVNAGGAWSEILAESIGALRVPLTAYRRHLFYTDPSPKVSSAWPFVWDLSLDFYFRPESRGLLLSACDKFPVSRSYRLRRREETDPSVRRLLDQKLSVFSPSFGAFLIRRAKSGLRTMVPDGRFVIGEDPRVKRFYWVAGLGGHGVTTSFSVGKLASDIILGRRPDPKLVKAFSPARFVPHP